ncbi:MAG: sodium:solute symporter family protein [Phycisphaerales bacterium]|nr:sodium:solute symporter family protein [Phycisphaerales bacterium]
MNTEQIPVWIILGYLSLLLILGLTSLRFFRGTAADYFLASRGIGSFLLVMSLFGTTMTAFALIGSTGESFKAGIGVYGLMASWSGIIHSACFFLVGIKLWSFGKRHGYVTQIQFFRDRFESNTIGLILFPILVGLVIPYLLIGVMGAGVTIEKVTAGAFPDLFAGHGSGPTAVKPGSIPYWLGSAVICIVVLIYVFLGGVRGAAWANAFQTIVFMILGLVTFVVIADKLGGVANATKMVQEHNPHKLRRSVRPDDPLTRYHGDVAVYEKKLAKWQAAPEAKRGPKPREVRKPDGISYLHFLSYLFIPLSVGMFPHLFQHWLTAKSAKTFRLAVVLHPFLIMVVWVPCVLVGAWATSAVIDGSPVIPYGFSNPNAVLGLLVKKLTTPVLSGFLTAGILAAIMSSLDSQFLCIGSIFANDIVAHYISRDRLTDRQRVVYGRLFVVFIVLVTYLLALTRPGGVFTLGVWCFSGFASLFPLVFAAVYWKRATKAGAYASILTTAAVWVWLFAKSGYGANREFLYHDMMPVATIITASTVALVVVSLMTRPPSPKTVEKFFNKA